MSPKDYSVRVLATPKRIQLLEKKSFCQRKLSPIKDIMFKPIGIDLTRFYPDRVYIRLREDKNNDSTLDQVRTIKTKSGYTDRKKRIAEGKTSALVNKAKALGYQQWGKMKTVSIEYQLQSAKVFFQKIIPGGEFLKIESPTEKDLNKALQLLKVKREEMIKKNAAVLLAEKIC